MEKTVGRCTVHQLKLRLGVDSGLIIALTGGSISSHSHEKPSGFQLPLPVSLASLYWHVKRSEITQLV
ncbi:hypothetical protein M378DRAFT_206559 [Amanita muscaria Koide BX008]|uniref:Uncharacterized protein n=1 Tax=Amanita muscaria (strain Koide BX008) TaxID=946122 RepID=A0A0C2XA19_AMAMK|nr:hypothetical protein M378DRAFT_206559 [Amanita muscaria Koide BX008]